MDNSLPKPNVCRDKITYETIEEARAADTTNSFRYAKPRMKVYRCRQCNLYHLTNRSDDD